MQETVGRIYIGQVTYSRTFAGQTRGRRYLEPYQCIAGEACEGCGCICVCKTNDRREDYRTRFYRARLRNH